MYGKCIKRPLFPTLGIQRNSYKKLLKILLLLLNYQRVKKENNFAKEYTSVQEKEKEKEKEG